MYCYFRFFILVFNQLKNHTLLVTVFYDAYHEFDLFVLCECLNMFNFHHQINNFHSIDTVTSSGMYTWKLRDYLTSSSPSSVIVSMLQTSPTDTLRSILLETIFTTFSSDASMSSVHLLPPAYSHDCYSDETVVIEVENINAFEPVKQKTKPKKIFWQFATHLSTKAALTASQLGCLYLRIGKLIFFSLFPVYSTSLFYFDISPLHLGCESEWG